MVGSGWSANYYPFGEVASQTGSDEDTRYDFTGKERDRGTNLMYFGARYYDPETGRWVSVDPSAENYPGWSPYHYAGDNPLIIIDPDGKDWYNLGSDRNPNIRWFEGSDPVAKPGLYNAFLRLIGAGGYATSLGANVVVGHRAPGENFNTVNAAIYEYYLETNHEGPVATITGNTVPSDPDLYATMAPALYTAELVRYHGLPALLINGGGRVATIGNNPNPRSPFFGRNGASGIYFHAGYRNQPSLWAPGGVAISKGCQTGCNGNRQAYLDFMANFPQGWRGNYYLIQR